MPKKVDVLNLEWTSNESRDREVVSLIMNYLRMQGVSVFEGPVFNAYRLLDTLKPKVLYITNSVGAKINIDVIRYAKSKGVKCITGMAEGNFNELGIEQFVWGVNSNKILFEDKCYLWNKRSYHLALKYYPFLRGRIGVCGAVGFDRYKIVRGGTLNWLKKEAKKYKQTIGIGCWNFDFTIEGAYCYKKFNGQVISSTQLSNFRNDREKFNQELVKLITANPDKLFIIKRHPGCLNGDLASGISGCRKFSNVIIGTNEFSIMEAIESSDIWLSYESTTAMEAWLMGKPTGLLNPSGTDFPFREGFHWGQPNFCNADEWSKALDELLQHGHLQAFIALEAERKNLIQDILQWDDGLNHVRMGNAILDLILLDKPYSDIIKLSFREKIRVYKAKLAWSCRHLFKVLPSFIAKNRAIYLNWNHKAVETLSAKRYEQQKFFYAQCNMNLTDLLQIKAFFDDRGK